MSLSIQKRVIGDNTPFMCGGPTYTLYVLVEDGRRIDSFLHKRNARRKRRQLLRTQSATPVQKGI